MCYIFENISLNSPLVVIHWLMPCLDHSKKFKGMKRFCKVMLPTQRHFLIEPDPESTISVQKLQLNLSELWINVPALTQKQIAQICSCLEDKKLIGLGQLGLPTALPLCVSRCEKSVKYFQLCYQEHLVGRSFFQRDRLDICREQVFSFQTSGPNVVIRLQSCKLIKP